MTGLVPADPAEARGTPLGTRLAEGVKRLMRRRPESYQVAIGAVVKNEAPYLLEWVAFHRMMGVEHFFIADNDSDDGTTALLEAMQGAGLLTTFRFRTPSNRAPQLEAYREILARHAARARWLAFIDADEFMVAGDPAFQVGQVLAAMPDDVGAVALNWAIYGSSGRLSAGQGPVTERFTRRGPDKASVNHHYKSIVRTRAVQSVAANPHLFVMNPAYRSVHADNAPVIDHPKYGVGLSQDIRWSPVRLNHYVIKSLAEFDRKKAPRGRGMSLTALRDRRFFMGHDQNDIVDPLSEHLSARARAEAGRIRDLLLEAGCHERLLDSDLLLSYLAPSHPVPCGKIETAIFRDDAIVLKGWALDHEWQPPDRYVLEFRGERLATFKGKKEPRPDVVTTHAEAALQCGFRVSLDPRPLVDALGRCAPLVPEHWISLKVLADGRFPLNMTDKVRDGLRMGYRSVLGNSTQRASEDETP